MAFKRGYSLIGLDLGETSAKMVQLRADGKRGWGLHAVSRVGDGREQDEQARLSMIKRMLAEQHFVGRKVATVLRRADVLIRPVKVSGSVEQEDRRAVWEALKSEARRYLPYPPEKAVLDFLTVGKVHDDEEEKLEVLLVSAPEDKVNQHISLLRSAGLHCVCIDIVPCTVLRVAQGSVGGDLQDAVVVVEIGERATVVSISRADQLLFSRSVNTGGGMLTDAIADELGLALEKAERFKRTYGIDHRGTVNAELSDETKLSPSNIPATLYELCQDELDGLAREIRRSVEYFATQFREIKVEKAVLFGGGANLKGLTDFLGDQTGLEVRVGDPFAAVRTGNGRLAQVVTEDKASFAVALGLASRKERGTWST